MERRIQMLLDRSEEAVRYVLRDLAVPHPCKFGQFFDARDKRLAAQGPAGDVVNLLARHGVNPLPQRADRRHQEPGLLPGLTYCGFFRGLVGLDLPCWELP